METTIRANAGWLRLKRGRIGAIIPAAVIIATVADPWVILTRAESDQARKIRGTEESAIDSARILPIPLNLITESGMVITDSDDGDHAVGAKRR